MTPDRPLLSITDRLMFAVACLGALLLGYLFWRLSAGGILKTAWEAQGMVINLAPEDKTRCPEVLNVKGLFLAQCVRKADHIPNGEGPHDLHKDMIGK